MLAMGRTTLVTIVGAMRMVPRTWVRGAWVSEAEPAMDRQETPGPPPSPPAAALSPLDPPSPSSEALFLFLSEPSSPPPPPVPLAEVESE